jgi:hypothetical protein
MGTCYHSKLRGLTETVATDKDNVNGNECALRKTGIQK